MVNDADFDAVNTDDGFAAISVTDVPDSDLRSLKRECEFCGCAFCAARIMVRSVIGARVIAGGPIGAVRNAAVGVIQRCA